MHIKLDNVIRGHVLLRIGGVWSILILCQCGEQDLKSPSAQMKSPATQLEFPSTQPASTRKSDAMFRVSISPAVGISGDLITLHFTLQNKGKEALELYKRRSPDYIVVKRKDGTPASDPLPSLPAISILTIGPGDKMEWQETLRVRACYVLQPRGT